MNRYYGFETHLFQIHVPESLAVDLITTADQQAVINARQQAAREAAAKIRSDGGVSLESNACTTLLNDTLLNAPVPVRIYVVLPTFSSRSATVPDPWRSMWFAPQTFHPHQTGARRHPIAASPGASPGLAGALGPIWSAFPIISPPQTGIRGNPPNGGRRCRDYICRMKLKNRKTMKVFAGFMLVAGMAFADLFTIGGFTFNDDNSVTTASVVEGSPNVDTHSAPLFAGKDDLRPFASGGAPDAFLNFKRDKTIGRLLGGMRTRKASGNPSLLVSFPGRKHGPPWANVDRCTIELTWSGKGLRNKSGPDFVIYEVGKSEGMAVSVRKAGSTEFTAARSKFASFMDLQHNATSIAFDLSSFGLGNGEIITAIRIRNLFNSQASAGEDKVDAPSGEGGIMNPADSGYSSAATLTARLIGTDLGTNSYPVKSADEGGGRKFGTDSLDADIVFVVGLHDIESLGGNPATITSINE